jgi:hypothetical protein
MTSLLNVSRTHALLTVHHYRLPAISPKSVQQQPNLQLLPISTSHQNPTAPAPVARRLQNCSERVIVLPICLLPFCTKARPPAVSFLPRQLHNDNRAVDLLHNVRADAPREEPLEFPEPPAPNDDEVRRVLLRGFHDLVLGVPKVDLGEDCELQVLRQLVQLSGELGGEAREAKTLQRKEYLTVTFQLHHNYTSTFKVKKFPCPKEGAYASR